MDEPRRAWTGVLALMIATYVAVFGTLTWRQHANFGTFGFDMGIYDQGLWLLAHGERAFVTVRGLHLFGHHVNPILFLFVPLYWLGAGPGHLYLIETVALALGAVPLYLLGRRASDGRGWVGCAVAAAYLLHPSIEWINWWHFHPDALAITPLLFAWWFATTGRWRWFAVSVVMALAAKEDIGLAVAMLGIVLVAKTLRRSRADEDRRAMRWAGIASAVAGAGAFAVATQLVIPHFLGGDPFYAQQFFPQYGDSTGSVIIGMLTSPDEVFSTLTEADRIEYYRKLVVPTAFLPFGAPLVLLMGAPQLGVNALSSLGGTYDFRFHYSSVVLAALFLGTVGALRRAFSVLVWFGSTLTGMLVVAAVASNIAWSPSPFGAAFDTGIWSKQQPRHDAYRDALERVPDDASVVANYHLVPHLTHRKEVYEWPNPWVPAYYGLRGENLPDPSSIDVIVIDRALQQQPDLLRALTSEGGDYEVVFDRDGVVVATRRG